MSVAVIIPARGGSKGILRKNLQPLGGHPLVGWSVRAALAAESVDAVYVSTEDAEIARVAASYGAAVIERPAELAADTAPTMPVVEHAVGQMPEPPEIVVILQCTSPLTAGEDIDLAVGRLRYLAETDAVVSVVADNSVLVDRRCQCLHLDTEELGRCRQERPEQYRFNGSLVAMRTPVRGLWECRRELYIMPPERSIDIDGPVDLAIAESLARYGGAWIVVGGGPDAREMLNLARRRCPTARIITTNGGIGLFEPPDVPDVYYLNDQEACRVYHDRAVWMQRHGTRLATLRRVPSAMASRRVDGFDEFLPGGQVQNQFSRGGYSGGLSGLVCLEYAVNHGARRVHLVGMGGYAGQDEGDHFSGYATPGGDPERKRRHTREIIGPFTQAVVDACQEVEFIFYGRLNYRVTGRNVERIAQEVATCE